jgi:penicillin-binding protein-related factor A (putative recombinase)
LFTTNKKKTEQKLFVGSSNMKETTKLWKGVIEAKSQKDCYGIFKGQVNPC